MSSAAVVIGALRVNNDFVCSLYFRNHINLFGGWKYSNSAYQGQTPQTLASEQDLHCLLTGISMQNANKKYQSAEGAGGLGIIRGNKVGESE